MGKSEMVGVFFFFGLGLILLLVLFGIDYFYTQSIVDKGIHLSRASVNYGYQCSESGRSLDDCLLALDAVLKSQKVD